MKSNLEFLSATMEMIYRRQWQWTTKMGIFLALDTTARDFHDEAKNKVQPWSLAKGFDTSCPVSEFIDKSKVKNLEQIGLWLKVNNIMRQNGNTKDMIFSVPYLISYVSQYFTLEVGDVILTGTPSGVGPVTAGT